MKNKGYDYVLTDKGNTLLANTGASLPGLIKGLDVATKTPPEVMKAAMHQGLVEYRALGEVRSK